MAGRIAGVLLGALCALGLWCAPAGAHVGKAHESLRAHAAQKRQACVGLALGNAYSGPCSNGAGSGPSWGFPYLALSNGMGPVILQNLQRRGVPPRTRDGILANLVNLAAAGKRRGPSEIYDWAKESKQSRLKARLVTCAVFGALVAGVTAILKIVFEGHTNIKVPLEAGAGACAAKVASPPLQRFLARHGFNLEA